MSSISTHLNVAVLVVLRNSQTELALIDNVAYNGFIVAKVSAMYKVF